MISNYTSYFIEHPEENIDEWWKTVDKAKIVMQGIMRGVDFWNWDDDEDS